MLMVASRTSHHDQFLFVAFDTYWNAALVTTCVPTLARCIFTISIFGTTQDSNCSACKRNMQIEVVEFFAAFTKVRSLEIALAVLVEIGF